MKLRYAYCLAFGVIALAMAPFVAIAQTSIKPVQYQIDFRPLLDQVVWPTLGVVATVLASWLAKRATSFLKLSEDNEVRRYLDVALHNAVDFARAKADGAPLVGTVKSEAIAEAANYAVSHVPDALKRFGIDRPALERLLEARLGRL